MSDDVTQMLIRAACGEEPAAAKLLPVVYENLRALAGRYLLQERGDRLGLLVGRAAARLLREGLDAGAVGGPAPSPLR